MYGFHRTCSEEKKNWGGFQWNNKKLSGDECEMHARCHLLPVWVCALSVVLTLIDAYPEEIVTEGCLLPNGNKPTQITLL